MKFFGILLFVASCCFAGAQANPSLNNSLLDDVSPAHDCVSDTSGLCFALKDGSCRYACDWNEQCKTKTNFGYDYDYCSSCFHSEDTVKTPSGTKTLKDIAVNDLVLTISEEGTMKYEPVLFDAHPLPDAEALFVKIETPTRELMVTPGHYIHLIVSGETIETSKLVKSDDIKVGDPLLVYSYGSVEVEKVERVEMVRARGISNPIVSSGRILVNDVLASIYSDDIPNLSVVHQHQLFWAWRQFFKLNLDEIFTVYRGSNGIPLVANYFLQLTAE